MTGSESIRPQLPTNFLGFLSVAPNQVVQRLITSGNIGFGTGEPRTTLDVRGPALVEDLTVDGTATVGILEITGGGDLAEEFIVSHEAGLDPGTVMVIDENRIGALKASDRPYDLKVAGVIAGARCVAPGLVLRPHSTITPRALVAIAGRVWCKAEAFEVPIYPGDCLSTSKYPGHAMKATDERASRGAILGKAMSRLESGQGVVLALVNLQ